MFRRRVIRVVTLAAAVAVALGCAELLFRWHTRVEYADRLPEQTGDLILVPAPQLFAFKPNTTGSLTGGVDQTRIFTYRTNGHGLRDRDRSVKSPGTRRVLVIGDSYTWGYAVAEHEAYPQVAEQQLAARHRPDVEVINAGVPDYNSRQERQLLEQLIPIYQPDAVFLGYVMNDAEPPTSVPVPPEETYRHAPSWFLSDYADHLNRHFFRRRVLPSTRETSDSSYLDGFRDDSMKWRDSREAIRQMRDLASASGIAFEILILPDVTQPLDERYPWQPIHAAVARWGRELSIPTSDLLDQFRGRDHRTLMVPWDGHPNAAAHEEIATFLVGRILGMWPKQGPSTAVPKLTKPIGGGPIESRQTN